MDGIEEELEHTKIKCPDCKSDLFMGTQGNGPDDYYTYLKCVECGYYEQD